MAVFQFGGQVTIQASAKSLTDLLIAAGELAGPQPCNAINIRAELTNVARIFFGLTDGVTVGNAKRCGFLQPGEDITIALMTSFSSSSVFLVGTVNDAAFIWGQQY